MTATTTKKDAPAPYVMPRPGLGPCLYYMSSDSPPTAAFITDIQDGFVTVAIFAPDNRSFLVRDGVRYVGDPMLKKFPMYENGTWDFTEDSKALTELAVRLDRLAASLGEKK